MLTSNRRYDIDWIRVIAIGLLLIYHVAIAFQPWGVMIGFIANKNPWEALWIPMMMLNVWRIPLLFFVSGMGVYFALQQRDWKQLIGERARRILLPFLVGIFLIVPIHIYIWHDYYNLKFSYPNHPGHLWFLGNIFVYVLVLSPLFFFLKRNSEGRIVAGIKRILSHPLGLLAVIFAFIVEGLAVQPNPYELYALTWHGFFLGLLAFFFGYCFVLSGRSFWDNVLRWRWLFLSVATTLFTIRITQFPQYAPRYVYFLVTESQCWIFTVFAFGYKYLNQPSRLLRYLSEAAYPVYILHMVFLYLACVLIFPLEVSPPVQFILVLMFTIVGCFAAYELIRKVNPIRPLFGLKWERAAKDKKFVALQNSQGD